MRSSFRIVEKKIMDIDGKRALRVLAYSGGINPKRGMYLFSLIPLLATNQDIDDFIRDVIKPKFRKYFQYVARTNQWQSA
jgi:hypothetical protein